MEAGLSALPVRSLHFIFIQIEMWINLLRTNSIDICHKSVNTFTNILFYYVHVGDRVTIRIHLFWVKASFRVNLG